MKELSKKRMSNVEGGLFSNDFWHNVGCSAILGMAVQTSSSIDFELLAGAFTSMGCEA